MSLLSSAKNRPTLMCKNTFIGLFEGGIFCILSANASLSTVRWGLYVYLLRLSDGRHFVFRDDITEYSSQLINVKLLFINISITIIVL